MYHTVTIYFTSTPEPDWQICNHLVFVAYDVIQEIPDTFFATW